MTKKKTKRWATFNGDILGDEYDLPHLKRNGLLDRTITRKTRFWCYKIHFAIVKEKEIPLYPTGLKEFIENLHGFAGWKYFAHTWDVIGHNPFAIVLRLQSVWQEWDAVMDRVAIPVDAPPEQIYARMQALADDYERRQKKSK